MHKPRLRWQPLDIRKHTALLNLLFGKRNTTISSRLEEIAGHAEPGRKGTVIYIAAPIGQLIAARADVWLKRLAVNAMKKHAAGLVPEVEGPTGMQVVYGRRPGAHVLSLVNLYAGLNRLAWPYDCGLGAGGWTA